MHREDGEESGGVCTNSQLHQHYTWAVSAGDCCVWASTVPRQIPHKSLQLFMDYSLASWGLPKETAKCKGRAQCLSHRHHKYTFSPGVHWLNALVVQVQQPGHSSFLMLPRVLVGKYK